MQSLRARLRCEEARVAALPLCLLNYCSQDLQAAGSVVGQIKGSAVLADTDVARKPSSRQDFKRRRARRAGMIGYIEDSYRSISIREAIGVCHGELAILVEKPHANWRRAAGG